MRADPFDVASSIGAPEFGLLFMEATRTGVDDLGMMTESVAASTFVKNGQKALA